MMLRRIGNRSTVRALGAVVLICLACNMPSVQADLIATISLEKTSNGDGRFKYAYKIENASNSSVNMNAFVLDVGPAADLQSLQGPEGWVGEYNPLEDPFELTFVSSDPQFDISAGSSGVFSIVSPLDAKPLEYFIANLAPDGSDLGSVSGDIDSPGLAVPEPPMCLLAALVTSAGPMCRRRRPRNLS